MLWKGYSGWFGLFGYLLVPGLFILVCFPNRNNRTISLTSGEGLETPLKAVSQPAPTLRYLFTLVPLVFLALGFTALLSASQADIDPAEWKELAPAGMGFRVRMPGTAKSDEQVQNTPAGNIELHKFTVEPTGKKEVFVVVLVRFPEEVGKNLGGPDAILEIGKNDIASAAQGTVKSQKPIRLGNANGVELEVLPAKGATVIGRIYVMNDRMYEVMVHVPKIRAESEDVRIFLNSFQLVDVSSTPAR
jgi:hypothetical protein